MHLDKEHIQLGSGVRNHTYFENSGSTWSELGRFVDKCHKLHVID